MTTSILKISSKTNNHFRFTLSIITPAKIAKTNPGAVADAMIFPKRYSEPLSSNTIQLIAIRLKPNPIKEVMLPTKKSFINLHKDQNHSELGAVNVAINNPKDCKFYLQNHGVLEFNPGTAYELNLVNYHTVVNNSNVPRYHIIIHGKK